MAFMPGIWRFLTPFGVKRRGASRVEAESPNDEMPDPGTADRRDVLERPREKQRLAERRRVRDARKPDSAE